MTKIYTIGISIIIQPVCWGISKKLYTGVMLKQMLLRKMLRQQLRGVPEEQQEVLIKWFEKNPQFFENIAKEIQEKTKEGKDQMTAAREVMQKYQTELSQLFQH